MKRFKVLDTKFGRVFFVYAQTATAAAWRVRNAKLGMMLIVEDAGHYDAARNVIAGDVVGDVVIRAKRRGSR